MSTTFLHRVRLKNYRSIGACDVVLGPLTFLVGPNGSGKSNFLDALRLVADALDRSLDHAIRDRGGVHEVRRRSSGGPTHFGIRFDFETAEGGGHYAFEVGAGANATWSVKREECVVTPVGGRLMAFEVHEGVVKVFPPGLGKAPAAAADRLYLAEAQGTPPFRSVFDGLSHMGFYNPIPDAMRGLQPPDASPLLKRDGSNVASTLARLDARPERKRRLVEHLACIVPGIVDVEYKSFSSRETVEFRQHVHGAKDAWRFPAQNMSDGTLRALGILLAVHQNGVSIPLVGIEEPETSLHPAAVGVLLASLRDAATRMQVLVTSHSLDLLDDKDVPDEAILAVMSEENESRIGPLDQAGRAVLREHLDTAREPIRLNQLAPEAEVARRRQRNLFDQVPREGTGTEGSHRNTPCS